MPAYLADLRNAAADGRLEERKLIEFLEKLLAVVTTAKGRKVFRGLAVDARGLFADLDAEKPPKLQAFLDKRLPRAFPN